MAPFLPCTEADAAQIDPRRQENGGADRIETDGCALHRAKHRHAYRTQFEGGPPTPMVLSIVRFIFSSASIPQAGISRGYNSDERFHPHLTKSLKSAEDPSCSSNARRILRMITPRAFSSAADASCS